MTSLITLAAAVFEISCGKTYRQTNAVENPTPATTGDVCNYIHGRTAHKKHPKAVFKIILHSKSTCIYIHLYSPQGYLYATAKFTSVPSTVRESLTISNVAQILRVLIRDDTFKCLYWR